MPITIQTGTPLVAGANSYVTEAEFSTYLSDRGYTLSGVQEPLLIRSYDLMESLSWLDSHDQEFTVTESMKTAQCEIAYRFSLGFDPFEVVANDGGVKREKVDVLETEYFRSVSALSPEMAIRRIPLAYSLLRPLLAGSDYIGRA